MMEKDKNDIIFSPEMRINGLIWRIKLYPLGNNSARGEYISIFLELTDGLNDKSVYYYKIELINFQRKKNIEAKTIVNIVMQSMRSIDKDYSFFARRSKSGILTYPTDNVTILNEIFCSDNFYRKLQKEIFEKIINK